ncbi:hypothetical protein C7974DRAFT_208343 [Boeremia exigua]|uniref:uncharacterized protein n=1 Tax=Boeremia exigua TaxID=749465 RepID=UPI001E8E8669|nr:uncharacterized protein C7974DRAFT_208343 [Boeremia exigua]KAH6625839.1 hypothetical protein C7974DRAFT_208343 [Boeremia exigua]
MCKIAAKTSLLTLTLYNPSMPLYAMSSCAVSSYESHESCLNNRPTPPLSRRHCGVGQQCSSHRAHPSHSLANGAGTLRLRPRSVVNATEESAAMWSRTEAT